MLPVAARFRIISCSRCAAMQRTRKMRNIFVRTRLSRLDLRVCDRGRRRPDAPLPVGRLCSELCRLRPRPRREVGTSLREALERRRGLLKLPLRLRV